MCWPLVLVCLLAEVAVRPSVGEYIGDAWADTCNGRLLGRRRREDYPIGKGAVTDTVDEYLGVPYAAPPVGENRFRLPQKLQEWEGSLNCTRPGWVCPQIHYYTQTDFSKQSEDCLTLNIYVPVMKRPSNPWPTMVFIHGGSYEEGAGIRYDGFSLAVHGSIVVTINYRLAVLGFLTLGDERLPGNYGLWDQVAALKWLKTNLPYFHGDPDRVTVFGSSAGASSVGLLLLSPKSEGLFQRAILQSGSPVSPWALYNRTVDHEEFVRQVGRKVGCLESKLDGMISCLRQTPHTRFAAKHWEFPRIVPSQMNFKPIVDGALIPDWPERMLRYTNLPSVTTMSGVVREEWARSLGWFFRDLNSSAADHIFVDGFERVAFEQSVNYVITDRFWWPHSISDVITHEYTDWSNKSHPMINRQQYVELTSDLLMVAPAIKMASALADRHTGRHGFFYLVDIPAVHERPSWWSQYSYHSVELDYVFGSPFNGYNIGEDRPANHSELERQISRNIMTLWTNFAKYGNPTPDEDENLPLWEEFESSRQNYYHITSDSNRMEESLRASKMHFWNHLIPSLYGQWEQLNRERHSSVSCSVLCWAFLGMTLILAASIIVLLIKLRSTRLQLTDIQPQKV